MSGKSMIAVTLTVMLILSVVALAQEDDGEAVDTWGLEQPPSSASEEDAEKIKAFRGINFKESSETVRSKIADDKEIDFYDATEFGYGEVDLGEDERGIWTRAEIVEIQYGSEPTDIVFGFSEDKLYFVKIGFPSRSSTAQYHLSGFYDIKSFRDQLLDMVSSQYGPPAEKREKEELNFSELDNNTAKWSHKWILEDGEKEIQVEIGKGPRGFTYEALVGISYIPLYKEAMEAREGGKGGSFLGFI